MLVIVADEVGVPLGVDVLEMVSVVVIVPVAVIVAEEVPVPVGVEVAVVVSVELWVTVADEVWVAVEVGVTDAVPLVVAVLVDVGLAVIEGVGDPTTHRFKHPGDPAPNPYAPFPFRNGISTAHPDPLGACALNVNASAVGPVTAGL